MQGRLGTPTLAIELLSLIWTILFPENAMDLAPDRMTSNFKANKA
jgi:hypothetical protein